MTIKFNIPNSWGSLSQKQLRTVFKFMASDVFSISQIELLLGLRFAGAQILKKIDEGLAVSISGSVIVLDIEDMLCIIQEMKFIESVPDFPVRIFEMNHRKAVHPLMRELSFAQWLAIENLYAGFIQMKDPALLNEILSILYPAKGIFGKFLKPFRNNKEIDWRHISAINWIASFKKWLANRYKELYHEIDENSSAPKMSSLSVLESMESQIRALTKGDITKKEAVLEMDIHSALTELDALALESRKFKEATKK